MSPGSPALGLLVTGRKKQKNKTKQKNPRLFCFVLFSAPELGYLLFVAE